MKFLFAFACAATLLAGCSEVDVLPAGQATGAGGSSGSSGNSTSGSTSEVSGSTGSGTNCITPPFACYQCSGPQVVSGPAECIADQWQCSPGTSTNIPICESECIPPLSCDGQQGEDVSCSYTCLPNESCVHQGKVCTT